MRPIVWMLAGFGLAALLRLGRRTKKKPPPVAHISELAAVLNVGSDGTRAVLGYVDPADPAYRQFGLVALPTDDVRLSGTPYRRATFATPDAVETAVLGG